jgi:hypothetical protein
VRMDNGRTSPVDERCLLWAGTRVKVYFLV